MYPVASPTNGVGCQRGCDREQITLDIHCSYASLLKHLLLLLLKTRYWARWATGLTNGTYALSNVLYKYLVKYILICITRCIIGSVNPKMRFWLTILNNSKKLYLENCIFKLPALWKL